MRRAFTPRGLRVIGWFASVLVTSLALNALSAAHVWSYFSGEAAAQVAEADARVAAANSTMQAQMSMHADAVAASVRAQKQAVTKQAAAEIGGAARASDTQAMRKAQENRQKAR